MKEHTFQYAAKLIRESRHAVALTGAGISTPSGIPDFRSPGSGLWTKYDPMEVASIWSFQEDPRRFYAWHRPLAEKINAAKPNPAHVALAELEQIERLRAVITQNVDGLHQKAGSKRVLEVHGNLDTSTCLGCYRVVESAPLMARYLADGQVPRCEHCGGVMKPNVIFFGEQLPLRVIMEAQEESRHCDVMLVAGSSLEVVPAADLPLAALHHGARIILVNDQPTHMDDRVDVLLREDVAVALPRIVELCRG